MCGVGGGGKGTARTLDGDSSAASGQRNRAPKELGGEVGEGALEAFLEPDLGRPPEVFESLRRVEA